MFIWQWLFCYISLCCWYRIIWKDRAVYFEKWNCVHYNVSENISKIIIVSYGAVRLYKILSSKNTPQSCWLSGVNIEGCKNQLRSHIFCAFLHSVAQYSVDITAQYVVQRCTVFSGNYFPICCAALYSILWTLLFNILCSAAQYSVDITAQYIVQCCTEFCGHYCIICCAVLHRIL